MTMLARRQPGLIFTYSNSSQSLIIFRSLGINTAPELVNTGLTAVQVKKLLSLIAANCPMESLNLSANVLSMVEPELMAQAVNKLKDVTLIDTNLSVNQVLRIDHIS